MITHEHILALPLLLGIFDSTSKSLVQSVTGTVAPSIGNNSTGYAYQGTGNFSSAIDSYSGVDNANDSVSTTSVTAPSVNVGSAGGGALSGIGSSTASGGSLLGLSWEGWAAIAGFAALAFWFLRKH